MGLPQVVHQQFGGPDRGLITQLAWILSECRLDQGVDDPGDQGRAARAWGVEEACPEVEPFALAESFRPVVDGLTADLKRVGDLLGGESFGEPEHRLSPTPLLRQGGMEHEVFQFAIQVIAQDHRSHRATPLTFGVSMTDSTCQRTFCQGRTHSFSKVR